MEQYARFLKLFFNKAYVWHYLEANGELEEFYEAKESFRKLLDAYEELLSRAAETEDPTKRLSVVGATSSTTSNANAKNVNASNSAPNTNSRGGTGNIAGGGRGNTAGGGTGPGG